MKVSTSITVDPEVWATAKVKYSNLSGLINDYLKNLVEEPTESSQIVKDNWDLEKERTEIAEDIMKKSAKLTQIDNKLKKKKKKTEGEIIIR